MIFWYVFLLLLPFTFVGLQAYEDFVLNAYAWIMVGILFRLPKLALSAQFAMAPPSAQLAISPNRLCTRPFAGLAELRLAVVSPFVDRRHGTERALPNYSSGSRGIMAAKSICTPRVADGDRDPSRRSPGAGTIFWHRVPTIPGPHLVKFVGWMLLNSVILAGGNIRFAARRSTSCFRPASIVLNADVFWCTPVSPPSRTLIADQDRAMLREQAACGVCIASLLRGCLPARTPHLLESQSIAGGRFCVERPR